MYELCTNARFQKSTEQSIAIRTQIFEAITTKDLVPQSLVLDYITSVYLSYSDLWLFRRQFAYQLASLTFMTYIMHMRDRNASRLNISRATGSLWGSELIPSMVSNGGKPIFHNSESVPFRLTPNLQMLLGPLALEGIFSAAVLVIAKSLTEPEFKLEGQLSLFIRDEVNFFYTSNHRPNVTAAMFRQCVSNNAGLIVKRVDALKLPPKGNLPANQTAIDLISKAVNPSKLAQMDPLWMPNL